MLLKNTWPLHKNVCWKNVFVHFLFHSDCEALGSGWNCWFTVLMNLDGLIKLFGNIQTFVYWVIPKWAFFFFFWRKICKVTWLYLPPLPPLPQSRVSSLSQSNPDGWASGFFRVWQCTRRLMKPIKQVITRNYGKQNSVPFIVVCVLQIQYTSHFLGMELVGHHFKWCWGWQKL